MKSFWVFLTILLLGHLSIAQTYDLTVTPISKTINDIEYSGYETNFPISGEELQKTWWKHVRKFAVLTNMRSHYVMKIPTSDKSLLPITLIQSSEGKEDESKLFLAVFDQTSNSFKDQVKDILLEFKVNYYVNILEQKIKEKEIQLETSSSIYQSRLLDTSKGSIQDPTEPSDQLVAEINKYARELELLKRDLINIR